MAKTEHRRSTGKKRLSAEISTAVRAALDKKAQEIVVLDLRDTPAFTDFFLVCSGQNARQVQAIADSIEAALREAKVRPSHIEGYERAEWVLMDFFSFIVHVFTPGTRAFYSLERLWGGADRIEIAEDPRREELGR
ncbi:MAG TPA: ribosome silencing factor [Vicinamibacterales bacterium]|jgi:ribosome-associated protein